MPIVEEAPMSQPEITYGSAAVPDPPATPFAGVKSESPSIRIGLWNVNDERGGLDSARAVGTAKSVAKQTATTMTAATRLDHTPSPQSTTIVRRAEIRSARARKGPRPMGNGHNFSLSWGQPNDVS